MAKKYFCDVCSTELIAKHNVLIMQVPRKNACGVISESKKLCADCTEKVIKQFSFNRAEKELNNG